MQWYKHFEESLSHRTNIKFAALNFIECPSKQLNLTQYPVICGDKRTVSQNVTYFVINESLESGKGCFFLCKNWQYEGGDYLEIPRTRRWKVVKSAK